MAKNKSSDPVGGVVFFLAIASIAVLFGLSLRLLLQSISTLDIFRFTIFFFGSLLGAGCGAFVIKGHWGVFLHELKHSIVSNLSGNRAKGMEVNAESGSFAYEYTRKTAHMNAFISLAPYVFPLFTVIFFGIGALWFPLSSSWLLACVALGFGMDSYAHMRDVGPHQTDLQKLRGGYAVGLSFVLLVNATVLVFLLFWVLYGTAGWSYWLEGLARTAFAISRLFFRAAPD